MLMCSHFPSNKCQRNGTWQLIYDRTGQLKSSSFASQNCHLKINPHELSAWNTTLQAIKDGRAISKKKSWRFWLTIVHLWPQLQTGLYEFVFLSFMSKDEPGAEWLFCFCNLHFVYSYFTKPKLCSFHQKEINFHFTRVKISKMKTDCMCQPVL